MKVQVRGQDVNVTEEMVDNVAYKLSFLDKYILIDDDTTAQVAVKKHGKDVKLEITIPTKVGFLRSEVINNKLRDAVDLSIDKLEDQIRRQKTRLSRRHKEKLAKTFIVDDQQKEEELQIKRKKRVAVNEMDVEEAIMQMELLDHSFFVFRDVDNNGIMSIVYKREDGGYGLIEAV